MAGVRHLATVVLIGAAQVAGAEGLPEAAAVFKQGLALDEAGDLAGARKAYARAVELEPSYGRAWINLGIVQIRLRRAAEGRASCEKAREIDAHAGKAHYCIGLAHVKEGRDDAAAEDFLLALDRLPVDPLPNLELAHIRRKQKRFDEAVEHYRRAVRGAPDHPDLHVHLGYCYRQLGRWDAAEVEYRKAVQKDPESYFGHLNLGVVLVQRKADQEARAEYLKAAELKPDAAEPHYNLGNLHFRRLELDLALERYNHAATLEPKEPRYLIEKARAEWRFGWNEEALRSLDAARRLAGDGSETARSIDALADQIRTNPSPPRTVEVEVDSFKRAAPPRRPESRAPTR